MKKRVLSLILAAVMLLQVLPVSAMAAPKETAIGTAQELAAWDGTGNAYLTQDIDLSTTQWVTSREIATNAVLDGRGHKITGISITTGVDDGYNGKYYGLYTNLSGTVKNLGLVGTISAGETSGPIRAGLLAAIAGNNYSNVLNCYALGSVTAPNYTDQTSTNLRLGGLIGAYSNGTIQNCYSAIQGGSLTGSVPMMSAPTDCYYDSTVFTGTNPENFDGATTPKTTEEMKSQAFVDLLNAKRDFTGTSDGQASNEGSEWGIVDGYPTHVPFREKVLVEITDEAGLRAVANDLSGKYLLKNDIELTGLWDSIGMTGKPFKGSFDGGGHTISGLNVDAKLGGAGVDDDTHRGAGLFGCSTGTIKNLGVMGTVASDKFYDRLGGIVGRNKGTVENCFAKVKLVSKITDNNVYATGGIAGQNDRGGIISNCYSASTSEGEIAHKHGCIGQPEGTISNVYYDNTVYPFTDKWDRQKTIGKSTAEMQSSLFAKLINANRGQGMQWMMKAGDYPAFGTEQIPDAPALTGTVNITGTPKVGETLTAALSDFLTTDGLNYQWILTKDGKVRTVGGNADKYMPSISDVGGTAAVKITSSAQQGEIVCGAGVVIADDVAGSAAARAAKAEKLHNDIAFSYLGSSDPWSIIEMVAAGQKANLTGIDKFIKDSAEVFKNPKLQVTEDEKYIMALSALGIDAANMPMGEARINGVEAMAAKKLDGTNLLIFALPAYDSGNYAIPKNAVMNRAQIVTELLERQSAEGDWSLSGTGADPDMTAMAIHGLSNIYRSDSPDISAQLRQRVIGAVDLAVARLSELQVAEKSYGKDYRGAFLSQSKKANSNSTSMVICALASLGINPDTDRRFIKNGKSAVDGLLAFAVKDSNGFGFTDNKKKDDMATEQGFRALLCYEGITAANGAPYNIYKLGTVSPPSPPVDPDPNPDGKPEIPANKITATIRIVGDTQHSDADTHGKYVNWFQTRSFTLNEESSVYDLFMLAISSGNLAQKGAEKNYVQSIKAPAGYGGYMLSEFDNGPNSGWMYVVNDEYPDVGLKAQILKDGDAVVWHYVDDYTTERGAGKWKEAKDDAPPTISLPVEKPVEKPNTVKPEVTVDQNGSATVTITQKAADTAVKEVKANNRAELIIAPQVKGDAKKVAVTLPKTAVAELADGTKAALTVESKVAKISISTGALSTIAKLSGDDVSIAAEKITTDKMSAENKKLVGDHPVYDFSVSVGGSKVTQFGGAITVTLPYTLKAGEDSSKITVFYIDKDGKAAEMTGAKYDAATKSIVFETDHFSTFAVVYEPNKMAFTDVNANDWFYGAVSYVTDKKLFRGTSDTAFSPLENMQRAMLWTVLYRMEGSPAKTENLNWYSDAQKWAVAKKISDGTNPEGNITRQELAAIIYRYAETKKYDMSKTADISKFSDGDNIATWAKPAMSWAVGAGVITGRGAAQLVPLGNATRAEVAVMLERFANLK